MTKTKWDRFLLSLILYNPDQRSQAGHSFSTILWLYNWKVFTALPFSGMMIFWSAICKRTVKKKCVTVNVMPSATHVLVVCIGYHDFSIWFPVVSSTVQGGKGHTSAGVVHTGDERNCPWRKIFYNYMQQLQHKNIRTRCGERGANKEVGQQVRQVHISTTKGSQWTGKMGTHITTISPIVQ